jgi:hypothetical protein
VATPCYEHDRCPFRQRPCRARCERTGVERCRARLDEKGDFGSAMPILLVGVRWSWAVEWLCKPEVTGSIPVRSIEKGPANAGVFSFLGTCPRAAVVTRRGVRGNPPLTSDLERHARLVALTVGEIQEAQHPSTDRSERMTRLES